MAQNTFYNDARQTYAYCDDLEIIDGSYVDSEIRFDKTGKLLRTYVVVDMIFEY